ncbi:MAG: hypothetical protein QOF51_3249, partial [Chloroflexota bacterium]|nr:hypothetical protein [Chloroflexota bacterium]
MRPAPSHNLPIQLTSFIGRERETAEVLRRLASARLLTGADGVGKAQEPYDWSLVAFGVIFTLLALIGSDSALQRGIETTPVTRIAAVLTIGIAVLWTTTVLLGTLIPYAIAHGTCALGQCVVVQGPVEQFRELPAQGPTQKSESFVVSGVRFEYSEYQMQPGFRHMASLGGPIHQGLPVRIAHANGQILRLAVPADAVPPAGIETAPRGVPPLDVPIFGFAGLLVLWPLVTATIALLGGWLGLASDYRASAPARGRTFGMQLISLNALGSYRNAMNVTVGDEGISLQPILLFRVMHPRLTIPWRAVRTCTRRRISFSSGTVIALSDGRSIAVYGPAGQAIWDTWNARAARSA